MSRRRPLYCPACGVQIGWTRRGVPLVFRAVRIVHDPEGRAAYECPACGARRAWESQPEMDERPKAA
jgi:predicted RNA-binding Zn-ribbon protein involved in translation (DUF1610 family)